MKTNFTMYNLLAITCLALIFGLGGCNSDKAQPEPQSGNLRANGEKLLVAVTSTLSVGIEKIDYNAYRKPQRITLHGPGNVENVSYEANKVIYDRLKFGKVHSRTIYALENGLPVKSTFYAVDSSGTASEGAVTQYEYKAGKLFKEITTTTGQPGGFYYQYIYDNANENIAVKEVHDLDGTLQEKRTYEYTDIPEKAVIVNHWSPFYADGLLFPRRSKNLVEKMTVEYNGAVSHSTFSYELDQEGYLVKGKRVSDAGPEKVSEWTYKWE